MEEIWKEISNFPNHRISNLARVKRLQITQPHPAYPGCTRTYKERILNGHFNRANGWHVFLTDKDGILRFNIIARLVLEAFVRPPSDGEIARHLDDNKRNQSLENLAWGTSQDNSDDAVRNLRYLRGSSQPCSKLTEDQVREIRREYKYRSADNNLYMLAKKYNVTSSNILFIINCKSWTHVK
jgi:hypothetical protein